MANMTIYEARKDARRYWKTGGARKLWGHCLVGIFALCTNKRGVRFKVFGQGVTFEDAFINAWKRGRIK